MKNTDIVTLVICVDVSEKGAKSSNVKECAESGLKHHPTGVIIRSYAATTVLGWAFTLLPRCVVRAKGPS